MTQEDLIEKIKKRIEAPFWEAFGDQIEFKWETLDIRKTPSAFPTNGALMKKVNYTFSITIHYPELTLSNSMGLSHDIKDLYIRICFSKDDRKWQSFTGLRSTYNQKEWVSYYCHSHLQGRCTDFSRSFCTNGSNDLTATLEYTQEHLGYLSVMDVYLLKEQLHAYLSWESIEGVPYRKFQEIGLLTPYENDPSDFISLYMLMDRRLLNFPYPIKINKDFKIKNKEEIAKFIIQKIKEREATCPTLVRIGNRFYVESMSSLNINWEEKELFEFRGNPVCLKVIEDESMSQYDYYPRPDYLDAICKYWEDQIVMDFKENYIKDKVEEFKNPEYLNSVFSNKSLELKENSFKTDYIF